MPGIPGKHSASSPRPKAAPFSDREQHSRLLAWLSLACGIAVGVQIGHFDTTLLWAAGYALLYPPLSHAASRYLPARHHPAARHGLLLLDALHIGLAIVLLGYSLIPALLILLMLASGALLVDGPRLCLQALLASAAGALPAVLLLDPPARPDTPLPVSLACLLVGGGYCLLIGLIAHRQSKQLDAVRQALCEEKEKASGLASSLARYLSPQVWESIFSGRKSARLETQRKKLTVFFSDIRGFTELSEELEAEALTDLLNTYLDEMSKIALKYGGTIDKFIGDSVMIFFGDPSTQGARHDAVAAVSMAIAMRKHMKVLRQQWRAQGITKPLEIRMGINTGYCTVGNFGTEMRMDYTIIGREVNLASRLESAADSGEILISHETYALVKDVIMCRDQGAITVKGFSRPVQIYQVVDLRSDLGSGTRYLEHELPGFSMYLDTDDVRHHDTERVIHALQHAVEKLRDKVG